MNGLLNIEFWAFVGVLAGIYTIFSLGLQLQFGIAGLVNFGHVAFMAIGAYAMAILVVNTGLGLWLSALIAIAITMIIAVMLGFPTMNLRTDYLAISTIAFSEIIRNLSTNLEGLTGGPEGTINLLGPGQTAYYNGQWQSFQSSVQRLLKSLFGDGVSSNVTMLVIVWLAALILIVGTRFVVKSPWGRVLKSIREDEDAVAALGKNVFFYKMQALALGAAFGAIAGLFYAFQYSVFGPKDFEPLITFFAYVIIIMGGIGSIWGVPLGSLIFAFIFAGTRFLSFPPISYLDAGDRAALRLIIVGLIIVLLMAFRPQGMLGKKEELALEDQ